ncbi:MAG: GTP-binding protein [Phycisphaerales bacterium]|nr:GTP-binding protein [Phycisphaerales bacterium]
MKAPTKSDYRVGCHWESARASGAVAIARLDAESTEELDALLSELTLSMPPPLGAVVHRTLAGVDDGIVARISEGCALVMPHGAGRIIAALDGWFDQRCAQACRGLRTRDTGVRRARRTYPEAADDCEALALCAIARGASPRGIAMLLSQSTLFASARANGWTPGSTDRERARRLSGLLTPPRVVAIGVANVGKSSLLNAIAGRTVAIAMDLPGTTRDAVAARVELDGIIVDWFDTPGIRLTDDEVEVSAQAIAARIASGADLVLEVSAPGMPCGPSSFPAPRLRVCTRIDCDPSEDSPEARSADACVSSTHRLGLDLLARSVRRALVSDADLASPDPWLFDEALVTAP